MLGVADQLVVLDEVVLGEVVGKGFQGGEDHRVAEDTSLEHKGENKKGLLKYLV